MRVILDTSFIISAVKDNIDFLSGLADVLPGAEITVPEQVLVELERAAKNKELKREDREAAKLGLKLVANLKKIKLEKKYVDLGLLNYIQNHQDDFVATIDKKLKEKLRNVIFIRGRKKLELS